MPRSTARSAEARLAATAGPGPLLYRMLRAPARVVIQQFFGLTADGLEHLPPQGPFIVAANHHNYLDGVLLAVALPTPIAFS